MEQGLRRVKNRTQQGGKNSQGAKSRGLRESNVRDKFLQTLEAGMDVVLVRIDVHGSPRQGDHAGAELVLHVRNMRLEKVCRHGDDPGRHPSVLTQRVRKVIVVRLELVLLRDNMVRS